MSPRAASEEPGFTTRATHGEDALSGVNQQPASVPIFQTSTWRFGAGDELAGVLNGDRPGYAYGRGYGNPTVEAFESVLASLEGTEACFAFSSGMSAIHAVSATLAGAGDRVLASKKLYGGTYSLFTSVLPRYGVAVDLVDLHDVEEVRRLLPGAAFFYCETIDNPLCSVADLQALGEECQAAGVPAVVDNTFSSPFLCNPASYGFSFVVHSVTKMIAGHSDLVGGAVCCSAADRARIRETAIEVGGAMPPFEAWLALRGVATLELRMERMCANAAALCAMLASSSEVAAVHYPGLDSHPDHLVAKRILARGLYGSMFSFELAGGMERAERWCRSLELCWTGVSLGGTHTLVAHPALSTHRQVPTEARRQAGISDGLVRVSPGIENTEDLLSDFSNALS